MKRSQGSLAGWLFADLTLVLAVVMLSSWTINKDPSSDQTVSVESYNSLLVENNKLKEEVEKLKLEIDQLKAEIEATKVENQILKVENQDLKDRLGAGEKGVILEPVVITISARDSDSTQTIVEKIERELSLLKVGEEQNFSFALIFGGTPEKPSDEMLRDAKSRARDIGELLRGSDSQAGWSRFVREKYFRELHDIGLGVGYYKIELYPSN